MTDQTLTDQTMTDLPMTDLPMTDLPAISCCDEAGGVSRRHLLMGAALAGTTTVIGDAVLQAAPASARPAEAVLVVLSLRGAADGMSLVVPYGDPVYARARPHIKIPRSKLWGTNGMFGFHPALAPLKPLWNSGRLGAVHATGLPGRSRSHFAAMEELEEAAPGSKLRSGWLNRLVGMDQERNPLEAFNISNGVPPASMFGPSPIMTASSIDQVKVAGAVRGEAHRRRHDALHIMWDPERGKLATATRNAFSVAGHFTPVLRTPQQPAHGASYSRTDLGKAMATAARLIKGNVGVEVLTIDQGQWDMHTNVGRWDGGSLEGNARDLAGSIAAFFTDLGTLGSKVTVVALSEFGRRVAENGNRGLDHGWGNVMLLAGAGVRRGVHGRWPGLHNGPEADLQVTHDYRDVLSEVIRSRFHTRSVATVFPGFVPTKVGAMKRG